jgi:hypothetical protein
MRFVLYILHLIGPIVVFFGFIRLVSLLFSAKVQAQVDRYPRFHMVWGHCALLYVFLWLTIPLQYDWLQLREHREKVYARVQAAGGWDALRRDCLALAEQPPPPANDQIPNYFHYRGRDTNLPPALLALRARQVEYDAQFGRVNVSVFGGHSTGGPSTPYYGLEIVTRKRDGYQPGEGNPAGALGNPRSNYRLVAEGIYEIY